MNKLSLLKSLVILLAFSTQMLKTTDTNESINITEQISTQEKIAQNNPSANNLISNKSRYPQCSAFLEGIISGAYTYYSIKSMLDIEAILDSTRTPVNPKTLTQAIFFNEAFQKANTEKINGAFKKLGLKFVYIIGIGILLDFVIKGIKKLTNNIPNAESKRGSDGIRDIAYPMGVLFMHKINPIR